MAVTPPKEAAALARRAAPTVVFTIGHSTRPIEAFISLLRAHGVSCVVDVRTVPRSRHNPQFNQDSLPDSLNKAGLGYIHMPGLGGLRHAKAGSITNIGWRNASFRGYADYMQTQEFEQNLEELNHTGSDRAGRDHVRRSRPLALSSFAHRGCLARSGNPGRGHHEPNAPHDSRPDAVCQSARQDRDISR